MADHQEHHDCTKDRICCIVPNYLLQHVVDNQEAPANARACAARSLLHNARLHSARQALSVQHSQTHQDAFNGIVPSYMHQEVLDSPDASDEQKDRARKNLEKSASIRAAREGIVAPTAAAPRPKRLFRVLYDSEHSDEVPGNRLRTEKQVATLDTQGTNVWNYFGKTFEFFYEKFDRNSIDDLGMSMVGSIHFDDEEPPPGYDNAYWDGKQMVFGDGDAEIFEDFTRSADVIAHELTHGVTQHTANLEYAYQSGALNESMSDAFGSMVKQYINNQTAEQADWLIGASIFHKSVGASALRSMKAPGTAYKDTIIGSDRQPDHMSKYQNLRNTLAEDNGGVHINSGIPNKAFYLVATGLGGYSWEVAGKIWYDALTDPMLNRFAANRANWKKCFPFFAELTMKYAENYTLEGKDVVAIVKGSWEQVGIIIGSGPGLASQ